MLDDAFPYELTEDEIRQIDNIENMMIESEVTDTWSVSRIKTALSCPLRFHLHYNYGLKIQKPSRSMVHGNIAHKALAAYRKNLWQTRRPNAHVMYATLEEVFDNEAAADISKVTSNAKEKNGMKISIQQQLEKFHEKMQGTHGSIPLTFFDKPTKTEFAAVEIESKIPIIDIFSQERDLVSHKKLHIIIDDISKNSKYGVGVWDHKFVSKQWSKFQIITDIQLIAYAYAFRYMAMNGYFPEIKDADINFTEDCVGFNLIYKTKEPKVSIKNHQVEDWQIKQLFDIIRHLEHMESNNLYHPSFIYEHYRCCNGCPFNIGIVGTDSFNPQMSICMQYSRGASKDDLIEIANKINAINKE
jgi:hypothetical protein